MPDIVRCKNIVEAIKYLQPDHILTQCLDRDGVAMNYQKLFPIQMEDGRILLLYPWSVAKPMFFRGENQQYSGCKSSLFRIGKREDRIKALAKTYEFILFLNSLTEVKWYIQNNLWYEPWALAQHYEFATPMIDLTSEIAVAAFFATHRYDRVTKQYVLMKEGVGQLRWLECDPLTDNSLRPIGMQPYSRPSNQYGYGYWLNEKEDLADRTQVIEFEQHYDVNLRLKTAMLSPEMYYFPNEEIVRMANIIKFENVITNAAIDRMADDKMPYFNPEITRDEIIDVLTKAGTYIVDAPVICQEAVANRAPCFSAKKSIMIRPIYASEEAKSK